MPNLTNPFRRHKKTEQTPSSLPSSQTNNEKSQTMEGSIGDPSSTLVRVQRKVTAMKIPSCFARSKGHRHKRVASESSISEKPRYVHTPQHAADSFMRTTSPIPQYYRPMSDDFSIKTNAQIDEEKQELARQRAAERGRVHVVGAFTE